ncbi:MAG: MFS transporter [Pseudomonadota bacterium]|nr:MFS transporter [Pseudomonadota bacterium]
MRLVPAGSVLQHPAFAQFWIARVTTMMAYQMLSVGVAWQVYELTHRPLDLGLIGLAQFLPSIALVLLVGHVADRRDRRRIARLTMSVGALACAVLGVASATQRISELAIFAIVLVIGAARAFQNPAMQALLPTLVPPHELSRAVAASTTATQMATIVGPAVGGVMYAIGPEWVYAVCALLYLAGVLAMHRMRTVHTVTSRAPPTLASVFAGVAFIRDNPVMLGAISLDLFAVLLGGATALLPVYARDILHIGPWGLGVLRSAPAIGGLATALWLSGKPLQGRVGRTMFVAVGVYGAATMVFGASTLTWLSFLALLIMGASDTVSVVVRSSIMQLGTPDDMRGRVNAVNTMFVGASNQLGEFESGITAEWLGTVRAVVLGGAGTLAVVALWMRLFPSLLTFDRLDTRATPAAT